MQKLLHSILEAVGNTPLVELRRMVGADSARVLVKVEGLNVGGSIKTRTALNMIEKAEEDGLIPWRPGSRRDSGPIQNKADSSHFRRVQ